MIGWTIDAMVYQKSCCTIGIMRAIMHFNHKYVDSLKLWTNFKEHKKKVTCLYGIQVSPLCDFQMELASYSERFNGLRQERETLVMQLHHAVERANVASCRAEVIMTSYLMLLSIIKINNLRISIYTNIVCEQHNSLHRLCMQGPLQPPVVG